MNSNERDIENSEAFYFLMKTAERNDDFEMMPLLLSFNEAHITYAANSAMQVAERFRNYFYIEQVLFILLLTEMKAFRASCKERKHEVYRRILKTATRLKKQEILNRAAKFKQ